ncbi:5724_t:CDS:2 [Gigaspora rosea]|nr:5724_t:CDS:2 [Gigaspora rosea]
MFFGIYAIDALAFWLGVTLIFNKGLSIGKSSSGTASKIFETIYRVPSIDIASDSPKTWTNATYVIRCNDLNLAKDFGGYVIHVPYEKLVVHC